MPYYELELGSQTIESRNYIEFQSLLVIAKKRELRELIETIEHEGKMGQPEMESIKNFGDENFIKSCLLEAELRILEKHIKHINFLLTINKGEKCT